MTDSTTNGVADFDFSYLDIKTKTARYQLPTRAGVEPMWVEGLPAIPDVNPSYRDAILANSAKTDRLRQSLMTGQGEMIDEKQEREEDIVLFANTVIKAWGGVVNTAGNPVVFSPENVEKFLRTLAKDAPWVLTRLLTFYKWPDTFIDRTPVPPMDKKTTDGVVKN